MKTIPELLAPLAPFLVDEALTSICITPPSERDAGDDDEDHGGRDGKPKTPGPMPLPALA